MKIRINIIFFIFLASSVSSCSTLYIPSASNIPLMSHKGELQASACGITTPLINIVGGNGTVTYSPINRFIVQGSGHYASLSKFNKNDKAAGGNQYAEASIGFYDKDAFSNRVSEVYFGYGIGASNTNFPTFNCGLRGSCPTYIIKGKYNLQYVQFNYGSNDSSNFLNFAVSVRIFHFNYNGYEYQFMRNYNKEWVGIEPSIYLIIGRKNIRFYAACKLSLVSGAFKEDTFYTPSICNVGITYNFSTKKKSEDKKE